LKTQHIKTVAQQTITP